MSTVLYNTKYLQLKTTKSTSGNDWVYAHRPNAGNVVVILPVTQTEVLFLIEKRPPIMAEGKGLFTIGIAAGLVGDERVNETVEEAMQAELLEETGLIAERIDIKAKQVASSAGCVSETFTIAVAQIRDKNPVTPPIDDNGIITDRVWVNKKDVFKWLNDKEEQGYVLTAQSLAALFYLFKEGSL